MSTQAKAVRITPKDTVAVALEPLTKGMSVCDVTLTNDIPAGHKFALCAIKKGTPVIKYGYPIGETTADVAAGEHIHVHNLHTLLSENAQYVYQPKPSSATPEKQELGDISAYRREDGRIGIRNEVWIIPTVGCVNKIAESLAAKANAELKNAYPHIDGFYAWTHPYGCSQLGTDHEKTRIILADLALHPNAAAVLVLGLGCENNTLASFKELIESKSNDAMPKNRIGYLTAQNSADEIADGMSALTELAKFASHYTREKAHASELVIGMKCGGSDGLSGISANPLVGQVCNWITSGGGSAMLTEVPEMFGAEQLLMNRCVSKDVFNNTVSLINDFKAYFVRHGQTVYENPSPGNKAGGITTLEDKSLGCVQKGGTAPVCGVLRYGDRLQTGSEDSANSKRGLFLLEGPGNDIVSTTALTAAGAHLILFTTGRGTPLGAPVPTLKIATNHPLAQNKSGWIDFDAADILSTDTQAETCSRLTQLILRTADGTYTTHNEQNGYREIAIMKEGVTL